MSEEDRQCVTSEGGKKVSADRAHMAEIGRKGGLKVSQNREHMAAIGRLGGAASRVRKKDDGSAEE